MFNIFPYNFIDRDVQMKIALDCPDKGFYYPLIGFFRIPGHSVFSKCNREVRPMSNWPIIVVEDLAIIAFPMPKDVSTYKIIGGKPRIFERAFRAITFWTIIWF